MKEQYQEKEQSIRGRIVVKKEGVKVYWGGKRKTKGEERGLEKRKKVVKLGRIESERVGAGQKRKKLQRGWFRMWMADLAECYSV
jgi:hypothetical protein